LPSITGLPFTANAVFGGAGGSSFLVLSAAKVELPSKIIELTTTASVRNIILFTIIIYLLDSLFNL
jgi:hypothetical protein